VRDASPPGQWNKLDLVGMERGTHSKDKRKEGGGGWIEGRKDIRQEVQEDRQKKGRANGRKKGRLVLYNN
jgi:hypothetical protein